MSILTVDVSTTNRLNINRPTKRGKEKSPSDGKRDRRLFIGVSTILSESHIVTCLANERGSV
jgi:hypothetical protein